MEEQRGRHGLSQVRVGGGVEGEAGAQGEAAIETVLMKVRGGVMVADATWLVCLIDLLVD